MCREPVPNILERASCVYHTNLPQPPPPLPAANLGLKVNIGSYINVCIIGQYNRVKIYLTFHDSALHWDKSVRKVIGYRLLACRATYFSFNTACRLALMPPPTSYALSVKKSCMQM